MASAGAVRLPQLLQRQQLAGVVGGNHGAVADGLKAAGEAITQHVLVGGAGDSRREDALAVCPRAVVGCPVGLEETPLGEYAQSRF